MGARQATTEDSHIALMFFKLIFLLSFTKVLLCVRQIARSYGLYQDDSASPQKRGQQIPNCGAGLRGSTSHVLWIPEEKTINSASDT